MKIVRKMLCTVLALSVLSPVSMMNASAEKRTSDTTYRPTSWSIEPVSLNIPWNEEQDYARVTKDGGKDGTAGIEINIESPNEPDRYFAITSTLKSTMTSGSTYRVSFDVKNTSGYFDVHFNWGNRSSVHNYIVESTDGDWKHVYKDITVSSDRTYIAFLAEHKGNNVIDNVSVQLMTDTDSDGTVDTPSGEELVNNGSFESYSHKYSFNPGLKDLYKSQIWNFDRIGGTNISTTYAHPTKNYAHSGEYSMYAVVSTDDDYAVLTPNVRVPFEAGNSYNIEFYAMAKNNNASIRIGWNCYYGWILDHRKSDPDENGWVRYQATLTIPEGTADLTNLWFLMDFKEEMLIDDVSVQLLVDTNDDGVVDSPDGNELVTDGGFENVKPRLAEKKYTASSWQSLVYDPDKDPITDEANNYTYFAEPTDRYAYSGDNSLHIAHPSASASGQYAGYYQRGSYPAGDYYLSFYVKGKSTRTFASFNMADPRKGVDNFNSDEWVKKEYILTSTADRDVFWFVAENNVDLYIDNVELYAAEAADTSSSVSLSNYKKTGENLLVNPDFEDVTPIKGATYSNLVAYPINKGSAVNISWNNPESYYIDDIKLYVDGKLVRNTIIDKSYGAFNEMLVDGLTNYNKYPVELKFTIDGTEYTYETTAIPDNAGTYVNFGTWKTFRMQKWTTDAKKYEIYPNTNVSLEKDEDGNTAMRINSNIPEIESNIYGNLISKQYTLRVDTEYVLKFKYKAENINRFFLAQDCTLNDTSSRNSITIFDGTKTTTDGWVEKEISLKPNGVYNSADMDDTTYSSTFIFITDQANGSLWIDDVELYAVVDYAVDDENLITEGDFEFGDCQISEPEFNLVAEDGTKTAINEITEGTIEVTAKIKNLTSGDSFKPAVIVALYNGTKLEKTISVTEKTIAQNSISMPAEEITASIEVPSLEGNDYSIKVMYWNGLGSLEPLAEYDVLETVK